MDTNATSLVKCLAKEADHGPAGDAKKADVLPSLDSTHKGAALATVLSIYDGEGNTSNMNVDMTVGEIVKVSV